jgi:hypothetical protein
MCIRIVHRAVVPIDSQLLTTAVANNICNHADPAALFSHSITTSRVFSSPVPHSLLDACKGGEGSNRPGLTTQPQIECDDARGSSG